MEHTEQTALFVHLSAHSSYSLLQGMPNLKGLAKEATKLGMPAIAVTDTNNMFGAMEFSTKTLETGIQPILGCQLNITHPDTVAGMRTLPPLMVTLLVQNEEGYRHIAELVSTAYLDKPENQPPQVTLEKLLTHNAGLICLSGCAQHGLIAQSQNKEDITKQLKEAFGDRLYIELQRHGWSHEKQVEPQLIQLASTFDIPVVATNDVRFLQKADYEAFDALLCIGESCTVDEPVRKRYTEEHYLKSPAEMAALFADIPSAIENSVEIAKRCAYVMEPVNVKEMYMPKWDVPEGKQVADVMREEAIKGLEERLIEHVYPFFSNEPQAEVKARYMERFEEEYEIIVNMGFDGYFLITSDFILWSKENDIPVGPGRGSGAGSLIAWCLDITDLDPIRWDLFFERFLNPERVSLPDFDVDFCQDRRDEVIRYVQQKYGADYVTQIITFGTLKAKACIRDVGRVLQMPYGLVSKIAGFIPEVPSPPKIHEVLEEDERLKQLYEDDEEIKKLLDIAMQLEGCYRHASTHAAGVHITDRPVRTVAPLFKDPRSDMAITALSMVDAEYAGLVKFDFLGLKTLSIIKTALDYVREECGVDIDILNIPLDDEKTFAMLQQGHTIGVFQIESAGMTALLKKAKPTLLTDLSAVIALYRPGPLGSGMVDDYIDCKHGRKEANYPHPVLEPVLNETFGVPVYQEQIMQMARDFAGYTLGGADMLRRAMGKKKPEEMAKHRDIFVKGAKEIHDVGPELANSIFDLMANFSGYGFNKAHTMAYALIAYQTAYLKAHYPLQFVAASMKYDASNTDKLMRYKQEIERLAGKLLPPDINASRVYFKVEENNIRHALSAIKGAGEEALKHIVTERENNGAYTDLFNFLERQTPQSCGKRQLEVLIKGGAFDNLYPNRAELLANVELLTHYVQQQHEDRTSDQIGLFGGAAAEAIARPKLTPTEPWDRFEKLEQEHTVIGFYLSDHPLNGYATQLEMQSSLTPIAELPDLATKGRTWAKIVGIVLSVRERNTKEGKLFGLVTLSDLSGQEEVLMFSETYTRFLPLLESKKPLLFELNMKVDGERVRILAEGVSEFAAQTNQRIPDYITLKLNGMNELPPIKQFLDKAGQGATQCTLIVNQQQGKQLEIKLPGGFNIGLPQIEQLRAITTLQIGRG